MGNAGTKKSSAPKTKTANVTSETVTSETVTFTENNSAPPKSVEKSNLGFSSKKRSRELPKHIMMTKKPNVHWRDIVGLNVAKEALKEAIIIPIKFPHLFKGKRSQVTGILLYGPPGTGKSYLAKAVATEASYTFFSVLSTDISKSTRENKRFIKNLFEEAKAKKPSIIFIDEIDVLCNNRSISMDVGTVYRIKNEFFTQMQGLENGVIVMGATNVPWVLDLTMQRWFQKCIYTPLPEEAARGQMIKYFIGTVPHCLSPRDIYSIVMRTYGYSGEDIEELVREALMMPLRKVQRATYFKRSSGPSPSDSTVHSDDLLSPCDSREHGATEMSWMEVPGDKLLEPKVTVGDFIKPFDSSRPTVNSDDLKRFEDYSKKIKQRDLYY